MKNIHTVNNSGFTASFEFALIVVSYDDKKAYRIELTININHRFVLILFEGFLYPVQVDDYALNNNLNCQRLIYDGVSYTKVNVRSGTTQWRCLQWRKGCRARLSTRSINGKPMTRKSKTAITHINHKLV